MERNIYRLANQIQDIFTETENGGDVFREGQLDEDLKKFYQQSVLAAIRKDRRMTRRKRLRAAAACLVILAAATALFQDEVRAAIGRASYSLRMALGLDSDLAAYKEVIHTSVRDGGYLVTLQEAVAAPEKLAVSYTVQREDGRPFYDSFDLHRMFDVEDQLWINGKEAGQFREREQHFLDEQETVLGGRISYDLAQMDLSGQNTYELRLYFDKGNWNFRFQADGCELYADTKRMTLGNAYRLPNGTQVTLDELMVNELEQRITMHTSEDGDISQYAITLQATDEQGRTAEFYGADVSGTECVMYAEKNSFLAADADMVTVRMYVEEFVAAGPKTKQGQVFKGTAEKIIVPPLQTTPDGAKPGEAASETPGPQNGQDADGLLQAQQGQDAVVWRLTDLQ